jgi:hypothetical protein
LLKCVYCIISAEPKNAGKIRFLRRTQKLTLFIYKTKLVGDFFKLIQFSLY